MEQEMNIIVTGSKAKTIEDLCSSFDLSMEDVVNEILEDSTVIALTIKRLKKREVREKKNSKELEKRSGIEERRRIREAKKAQDEIRISEQKAILQKSKDELDEEIRKFNEI